MFDSPNPKPTQKRKKRRAPNKLSNPVSDTSGEADFYQYTQDNLHAWDKIADYWEESQSPEWSGKADDGNDMFTRCLLPVVEELASGESSESVLDLGAGSGIIARLFAKKGAYATSLETPTSTCEDTANSSTTIRYDNLVEGNLLGSDELALVDSGARNFISESFLSRRYHTFDASRSREIERADGSTFDTNGLVRLPWKFKGDRKQHMVTFNVVADEFCQYAITLGGAFLRRTNMLRSLASRILHMPRRCPIPRVRLQGGGSLGMRGFCDGREVFAMPDTGSDIPLMSLEYARELGKTIDYSAETSIPLLLPGDHLAHTLGMVKDVEWRFGESEAYKVDFYIMNGLPVDLLLDDNFLSRTKAFEEYSDFLTGVSDLEEDSDLDDLDPGLFLTIQRLKKEHPSIINAALADIDSKMDLLSSQLIAINESALTKEARTAKIDELEKEYKRLAQRRRLLQAPVSTMHTTTADQNTSGVVSTEPSRFSWRHMLRRLANVKTRTRLPNASA